MALRPPVGDEAVGGQVGVAAGVTEPAGEDRGVADDRAAVGRGRVHGREHRYHLGGIARPGPAQLAGGRRRGLPSAGLPGPGVVPRPGTLASGPVRRSSDRAGSTVWYRAPASSQPSDR